MSIIWPAFGAGVILIASATVFLRPDLRIWHGSGPTMKDRLRGSAFGLCLVLGVLLIVGSFVGFNL